LMRDLPGSIYASVQRSRHGFHQNLNQSIMLSSFEAQFIGIMLEGFCFGLYSGIFFMYIQYQVSKKLGKNVIFYTLCILYLLSVATIVQDTTGVLISTIVYLGSGPSSLALRLVHLSFVALTLTGLCDFISQAILIYRCWVIWGRNIRVIIIPSFSVVAFLAIWLAVIGSSCHLLDCECRCHGFNCTQDPQGVLAG